MLHDWAEQYIDWSFSTLPSQIINVWALNASQYAIWTSGSFGYGDLLSTSSSDSGKFNVPSSGVWYIIFWNDEIDSRVIALKYDASFIGDSRPPTISISQPSSLSSYNPGSSQTIEWTTQGSVDKLIIELYKGDSLYSTITSNTVNDGQETWIVPDCPEASDYRIKIIDNSRIFWET